MASQQCQLAGGSALDSQSDSLDSLTRGYKNGKYLQEINQREQSFLTYLPPVNDLDLTEIDLKYFLTQSGAFVRLTWDEQERSLVYQLKHVADSEAGLANKRRQIEALLTDPYVNELAYNPRQGIIEVDHQRFGVLKTDLTLNPEQLQQLVLHLAGLAGKRLAYDQPLLAGNLPSGVSVKASLLPDLTEDWPSLHLECKQKASFSPHPALNHLSSDALAYLWFCLQHGRNIILAGDNQTKKSKRQLASLLVAHLPSDFRLASLDPERDLRTTHKDVIYPAARQVTPVFNEAEAKTSSAARVALKQCLRQDPDLLLVTDWEEMAQSILVQALISGHSLLAITSKTKDKFLAELGGSERKKGQFRRLLHLVVSVKTDLDQQSDHRSGTKRADEGRLLSIYELGTRHGSNADSTLNRQLQEIDRSRLLQNLSQELGLSGREIGQKIRRRQNLIRKLQEINLESIEEYSNLIDRFTTK